MKKRNLNILASLVIALALTGCNESEVDKITLIGQDKNVGLIEFSTEDCVRSELCKVALEAYQ